MLFRGTGQTGTVMEKRRDTFAQSKTLRAEAVVTGKGQIGEIHRRTSSDRIAQWADMETNGCIYIGFGTDTKK